MRLSRLNISLFGVHGCRRNCKEQAGMCFERKESKSVGYSCGRSFSALITQRVKTLKWLKIKIMRKGGMNDE
jgi:hypothetical protein